MNSCKEVFQSLVDKGEIKGQFEDDKWMAYSGIKYFGLCFEIDDYLYSSHIGKVFGIPKDTMINMLKCYVIYCNGVYIYQTIEKNKLNVLREFVQHYGDRKYQISEENLIALTDFLAFINTPMKQIDKITKGVKITKSESSPQRKLSPVINYLAIENEINKMYATSIEDEDFIKWFPIYFWVNITFVLPLRATEMLVTPLNCIERKGDSVYLSIRRTKLKKGRRTVYYDVEKDYSVFSYKVPDTPVISKIEKYIGLTAKQDRRFLFAYSKSMVNKMLSLQAFNALLAGFMNTHIIGNRRYDFVRYASGIKEFEIVSAGDSRPIALTNLMFQDAGEDICRQLADHESVQTTFGYYTNITETIRNSSIIQLQNRMESQEQDLYDELMKSATLAVDLNRSVCTAEKREKDNENFDDCIRHKHVGNCIGCKYYIPTKKEMDEYMDPLMQMTEEHAKMTVDYLNGVLSIKNNGEKTLEEMLLQVQTDVSRYKVGCDIRTKEVAKEWLKHKNSPKIYY